MASSISKAPCYRIRGLISTLKAPAASGRHGISAYELRAQPCSWMRLMRLMGLMGPGQYKSHVSHKSHLLAKFRAYAHAAARSAHSYLPNVLSRLSESVKKLTIQVRADPLDCFNERVCGFFGRNIGIVSAHIGSHPAG